MNLITTEQQLLNCLEEVKAIQLINWINSLNESSLLKITKGEFGMRMMNIAKVINLLQKNVNYLCMPDEKHFYKGKYVKEQTDEFNVIDVTNDELAKVFGLNFKKLNGLPLHSQIIIDYKTNSSLKLDVAIAPRYKNLFPQRNFDHWNIIVDYLLDAGLKVGVIGKQQETYLFKNKGVIYSFEQDDPSETSLNLLSNCKFFIGTDSGVAHVYHNLLKPCFLFRTATQNGPNEIASYPLINKNCYVKLLTDNSTEYIAKNVIKEIDSLLGIYL